MNATAVEEKLSIPPMDEHNETWLSHVHPGDWQNPQPASLYDLVVIGAGPAGLITAAGAAGLGAKVALVERHLMGGDCLNVGCVPSKTLLRSAKVIGEIRVAENFGVHIPDGAKADFARVMERMRSVRSQISHHDSARRYQDELGVDIFIGQGGFEDSDAVSVGEAKLHFRKAVIATGNRAAELPIPGLKEVGYLTNESIFTLTELPPRLAVIGAGPIGCEMAQAFRRFGAEVTILEVAPQILIREDQDAAKIIEKVLDNDGVNIILDCKIQGMEKTESGKTIRFESSGGENELEVDDILLSVGRAPNVEGLNLDSVGVKNDPIKGVEVDDFLQTANPKIFAAGDICFPYKFTHVADALARIVIQNALFVPWFVPFNLGKKSMNDLIIPWCTYTDPEIAHVGLYENDAAEQGIEVETFEQELGAVDRAVADGETEGFVKVHVRKGTDEILGATIVARHAGEMISEIGVAMQGKVGLGTIASTIHPYPTQAEAIKRVGDSYNRTRLTPGNKRFLQRLMKWS